MQFLPDQSFFTDFPFGFDLFKISAMNVSRLAPSSPAATASDGNGVFSQPGRECTCKVLDQDTDETLDGTEAYAVVMIGRASHRQLNVPSVQKR